MAPQLKKFPSTMLSPQQTQVAKGTTPTNSSNGDDVSHILSFFPYCMSLPQRQVILLFPVLSQVSSNGASVYSEERSKESESSPMEEEHVVGASVYSEEGSKESERSPMEEEHVVDNHGEAFGTRKEERETDINEEHDHMIMSAVHLVEEVQEEVVDEKMRDEAGEGSEKASGEETIRRDFGENSWVADVILHKKETADMKAKMRQIEDMTKGALAVDLHTAPTSVDIEPEKLKEDVTQHETSGHKFADDGTGRKEGLRKESGKRYALSGAHKAAAPKRKKRGTKQQSVRGIQRRKKTVISLFAAKKTSRRTGKAPYHTTALDEGPSSLTECVVRQQRAVAEARAREEEVEKAARAVEVAERAFEEAFSKAQYAVNTLMEQRWEAFPARKELERAQRHARAMAKARAEADAAAMAAAQRSAATATRSESEPSIATRVAASGAARVERTAVARAEDAAQAETLAEARVHALEEEDELAWTLACEEELSSFAESARAAADAAAEAVAVARVAAEVAARTAQEAWAAAGVAARAVQEARVRAQVEVEKNEGAQIGPRTRSQTRGRREQVVNVEQRKKSQGTDLKRKRADGRQSGATQPRCVRMPKRKKGRLSDARFGPEGRMAQDEGAFRAYSLRHTQHRLERRKRLREEMEAVEEESKKAQQGTRKQRE